MRPYTIVQIIYVAALIIWGAIIPTSGNGIFLISGPIIFIPLAFVSHRLWMRDHNANKAKPVWRYAFILCEFGLYTLFVAVVIWKLNVPEPAFPTPLIACMLALSYTSSWIRKHIDSSDTQ